LLRFAEERDVIALAQRHDGLLPVVTLAEGATHALDLAALDERVHAQHLDPEQRLDGAADLDLVGAAIDLEDDLVVVGLDARGLLGQRDRALDDVRKPEVHVASLLQRAVSCSMACFETTRWSCRRRSYTLTPFGGRNRFWLRFR